MNCVTAADDRNLLHYCRMTKIKALVASCAAVETDVQPHEPLHQVLQNVRHSAEGAAGMSLVPMAALYTSSNAMVPNWDGERNVGTADMTVVSRSPTQADLISQLMQRMAAQEQRMGAQEQMTAFLAAPRISNTAAQVLNHAAGGGFYESPDSHKFLDLGVGHASIQQLRDLTGTPVDTIITQADHIITRRDNKHVHFTTAAALQTEVEACQHAITLCPTLRQQLWWECWVLDNFAHFKTAFHPSLG